MIDDKKYGLPRLKKFPMPDAAHVKSAIRFFNYVTPANEKELANNILARIQEYDIDVDDINVGDNNRFKKYLVKNTELKHHGIKGQKWGVRRFQNPDGSYTALGAANRRQLSKIDRKYDKLAKKDAKEYARAKMSYGEGAGNRRKLIKNKVEQRRKENEHYNKVFDEYLAQEDMSKHADAAKRERTTKDAVKTTKRAAKTAVKVFNTVAPLLHDDESYTYLAHHGIKGQKWGVRRFQNPDGTLTPRGKKRYKKSIDYISDIKKGNDAIREKVNNRYAIARNNYEVQRDSKKEMIDDGAHTEESFRKMYPNYDIGTDYDKRTSDYYRDQIKLVDAMTKKLDDIDVTQQSYKKTKKLVDDIIDNSIIKLSDLKNSYVNSDEYIKYRDMLERTNDINKKQTRQIIDKYRL